MSTDTFAPADEFDVASLMGGLYGDGIIACQGAFSREWVAQLGQDIAVLFEEARQQPGGALERGPNRFYVEIHPERLRGFADIITHPWLVAVCQAVLGPDYKAKLAGVKLASIGPITTATLREVGLEPAVEATTFNIDGLVAAITGAAATTTPASAVGRAP